MTDESDYIKRFEAQILRRSMEVSPYRYDDVEIAASAIRGNEIVIIYREWSAGPLLGRRYDVAKTRSMFDPGISPEQLADDVYDDGFADPTGRGTRLTVDWADGLVDEPSAVEWVGFDDE